MKRRKRTILFILVGFILFILFFFSVIFSIFAMPKNTIIDGIYINGIDVSRMSKDEAKNIILQKCNIKKSSNFNVLFLKNNEQINSEYNSSNSLLPLSIEYKVTQAIDDAYLVGRNKNIFENNFDIIKSLIYKKNINLDFSIDNNSLEQLIDKIYSDVPNKLYYEKEPFRIFKEVYGIDFNVELAKNILSESKEEYFIPLIITEPDITISNLEIDTFPNLLATFSTRYDSQNKNRENNMYLATSKINEIIIAPGEEFSYNRTVGSRNIALGYKEAKIYSNGQVVDGIGGGICQVSSTLYNAVMFANLDVTERHNHQFITSYVNAGRDATVVYGSKDLKFVNNRNYPIKILATASNGNVKISIYGIKENLEYDVSFDNEIVENINWSTRYEYNPNLSSSMQIVKQLGANGAIINNYKIVKLNGAVVSKTLISQDKYNALNRIIETGNYDDIYKVD